jgi:hypothetical protein
LKRWDGVTWTVLVWRRIGTGGELLWIRYWTYGFHKTEENYRVASQLVTSRVVLRPIELFYLVLCFPLLIFLWWQWSCHLHAPAAPYPPKTFFCFWYSFLLVA